MSERIGPDGRTEAETRALAMRYHPFSGSTRNLSKHTEIYACRKAVGEWDGIKLCPTCSQFLTSDTASDVVVERGGYCRICKKVMNRKDTQKDPERAKRRNRRKTEKKRIKRQAAAKARGPITPKPRPPRKPWTRNDGYIHEHHPEHVLADSHGIVYRHRLILFNKIGYDGPHFCHWCEKLIYWHSEDRTTKIQSDHLDDDQTNNHPDNLVPSCMPCNAQKKNRKKRARNPSLRMIRSRR